MTRKNHIVRSRESNITGIVEAFSLLYARFVLQARDARRLKGPENLSACRLPPLHWRAAYFNILLQTLSQCTTATTELQCVQKFMDLLRGACYLPYMLTKHEALWHAEPPQRLVLFGV